MTFKNWKLIKVIQNYEKIESFLYVYLATDFDTQVPISHDAGEQIEVELMEYKEVAELAKKEPRLEHRVLSEYKSLDDLLSAPEFIGKSIDC